MLVTFVGTLYNMLKDGIEQNGSIGLQRLKLVTKFVTLQNSSPTYITNVNLTLSPRIQFVALFVAGVLSGM